MDLETILKKFAEDSGISLNKFTTEEGEVIYLFGHYFRYYAVGKDYLEKNFGESLLKVMETFHLYHKLGEIIENYYTRRDSKGSDRGVHKS